MQTAAISGSVRFPCDNCAACEDCGNTEYAQADSARGGNAGIGGITGFGSINGLVGSAGFRGLNGRLGGLGFVRFENCVQGVRGSLLVRKACIGGYFVAVGIQPADKAVALLGSSFKEVDCAPCFGIDFKSDCHIAVSFGFKRDDVFAVPLVVDMP